MKPQVKAIILAAGNATRYGKNKLFLPVLGHPLLYHSILAIHDHPEISQIFIVTNSANFKRIETLLKESHFPKVNRLLIGGKTRQASMFKGLKALLSSQKSNLNRASSHHFGKTAGTSVPDGLILVHNGANPLVTAKEISATIKAAQKHGAAICGHKIPDTIKEVKNDFIFKTHNRDDLRSVQTPQVFKAELLIEAINKAKNEHKNFTDESGLIENLLAEKKFNTQPSYKIKFVPASKNNFKITVPADYDRLKAIIGDTPKDYLVGIGQDSHEFDTSPSGKNHGLILSGFKIIKMPKLKADSDGDVIIHALCNAILQALGEKSLGYFATPLFKEKNIKDSKIYLQNALKKMQQKGFFLNNIGLMVEGRKPKMDALSTQIKNSLAKITKIDPTRIGLTATTGKNLTAFGKGQGLQCLAIVSLQKCK